LRIRIPDPDPGFDDLKLNQIYSWKLNLYFLAIYLSLGLLEKPSALKREHPATQINADPCECGYGSKSKKMDHGVE
jgi:hypothetical protein